MSDLSTSLPDGSETTGTEESRLERLFARLAEADGPADDAGVWPATLWALLVADGAPLWSLPARFGGVDLDRPALVHRYSQVAEGSMTAALILSQHDAAARRLLAAVERPVAASWLEAIAAGRAFTTVGIAQLTTSRRHGATALIATELAPDTYRLDGVMPWVTAAENADVFVTGAVMDDGRQLLIALPADRPGLNVRPPFALAALQASRTSEVRCDGVIVRESDLLAGPAVDVMAHTNAAGTGGLETSALALGQARAALKALIAEAPRREELNESVEALAESWRQVWFALSAAAHGAPEAPPPGQVRSQANALVLRITQAYLAARKGTGFLRSEPAQRWARQALFFLVWSCPGPVAQATIRELAGVCSGVGG